MRRLKRYIRRGEARQALRIANVPVASARFLDLPFYETGRYRQFYPGDADVAAIAEVVRQVRPHMTFATGAGQEPNSVGAICFALLLKALRAARSDGGESCGYSDDCHIWLYRTPDKAWQTHEINMAVPLSPSQLAQKTRSIYQHKRQRDASPNTSEDKAWQMAESANRTLAKAYDALGMAEYEAIEAFQRWEAGQC